MPKKLENTSPTTVIKWTEEEWGKIAGHLYSQKGAALLSSVQLEDVKAKDVFLAQEVLPEYRHRKLISVSQGFQTIRARLQAIFQKMSQARQEDLFKREHGQARPVRHVHDQATLVSEEATVTPSAPAVMPDSGDAAATPGANRSAGRKASRAMVSVAPVINEAGSVSDPNSVPETAVDTDSSGALETRHERRPRSQEAPPLPDERIQGQDAIPEANAPLSAHQVKKDDHGVVSTPDSSRKNMHSPGRAGRADDGLAQAAAPGAERVATRNGESLSQAGGDEKQAPALQSPESAPPAAVGLVELARPFVAMVCQELARAFISGASQKGAEQALSSLVHNALSQIASLQTASSAVPRHAERKSEQGGDRIGQGDDALYAAPAASKESSHVDAFEEEGGHPAEGEVQPLFDPKLPPSANSNFKPTIGLVGTNVHDLASLQQLYPQLRFTVVPADAVRSPDVFRHCQRIIGLQEEVLPPTDEFLRRAFRNRYVRLAGGIARVKEQLNSWLNKPGSMNAGPIKTPMQRNEKGPGEGASKKRSNRYPRSVR